MSGQFSKGETILLWLAIVMFAILFACARLSAEEQWQSTDNVGGLRFYGTLDECEDIKKWCRHIPFGTWACHDEYVTPEDDWGRLASLLVRSPRSIIANLNLRGGFEDNGRPESEFPNAALQKSRRSPIVIIGETNTASFIAPWLTYDMREAKMFFGDTEVATNATFYIVTALPNAEWFSWNTKHESSVYSIAPNIMKESVPPILHDETWDGGLSINQIAIGMFAFGLFLWVSWEILSRRNS